MPSDEFSPGGGRGLFSSRLLLIVIWLHIINSAIPKHFSRNPAIKMVPLNLANTNLPMDEKKTTMINKNKRTNII